MDFENIKISGADISVIGIAFIFKSSKFELWVKKMIFWTRAVHGTTSSEPIYRSVRWAQNKPGFSIEPKDENERKKSDIS